MASCIYGLVADMLDGKQHGMTEDEREAQDCAPLEGACRFNCRTAKESFLAGWDAAKTQRANLSIQTRQEAYREWKRR